MNFNKIIDLTNIHEENISCLAFYPVIQFPTGLIPDPVKISRIRNSVLKTSIFAKFLQNLVTAKIVTLSQGMVLKMSISAPSTSNEK